jgi:threonine dehydrogenase-like Zn-dependent dehydrogenase
MAALMGRQRGLEVHVQDRNESGPKPKLVAGIGGKYFPSDRVEGDYDVLVECTGAPAVIKEILGKTGPNSVTCLTGLSAAASDVKLELAPFNQSAVLGNRVVFGSVNANRRHYQDAARALARAEKGWLESVITRRIPLSRWEQAYERRPGDVKTVLAFAD